MPFFLRMFFFFIVCLNAAAAFAQETPAQIHFLLHDTGGRLDWGPQGLIAFDKQAGDWAQVWTMKPDGTERKCLTCGAGFPRLHNGNPAWHPSGKYIVFQSLDDRIKVPGLWGKLYRLYTSPGSGVNNNIWVMTDLGRGRGVLHPHFSHDGNTLIWAEMTATKPLPLGSWVIQKAAFLEERGRPMLGKTEALRPGNLQFYETHSFSPDDHSILFTGKAADAAGNNFDIYKYNLATGALQQLTDTADWDEHAQFSPDGRSIVWMSSRDIRQGPKKGAFINTDYWIMGSDGSGKKRLTRFNDPAAPEYIKGLVIAADSSWNPEGGEFAAYVQTNPSAEKPGSIVLVTVK